jgi:NAD(P)-dependent dehydrogenase (short-subunit alcohol dehydrogenase family)
MAPHKGKIALITGANKGIGYELARQLSKEGITVLIAARNAELGNAAARKLKADGADAHFIELDVTKPETIVNAAQTVRTRYGRLDILINNAGVTDKGDGPPSTTDPEAILLPTTLPRAASSKRGALFPVDAVLKLRCQERSPW